MSFKALSDPLSGIIFFVNHEVDEPSSIIIPYMVIEVGFVNCCRKFKVVLAHVVLWPTSVVVPK